ncbi:MAG: hypothetical protein Q4P11_04800 [Methanobrevibacter sp.]|nr:hypothetical protein [Methanobrevibacter sp.]
MNLFTLEWDFLYLKFDMNIIFLLLFILIILIKYRETILNFLNNGSEVDIKEYNLGLTNSNIKIVPNYKDKEIAYKIWVELSTRKIGIPLVEDDIIYQIYDSWYMFFGITRNLLKEFPVSKLKNKSSTEIIFITNEILNNELRNHLTKWQGKFRRWYEIESKNQDNDYLTPQELQKKYPEYDELVKDMKEVNEYLINYKRLLYKIVFGKDESGKNN